VASIFIAIYRHHASVLWWSDQTTSSKRSM